MIVGVFNDREARIPLTSVAGHLYGLIVGVQQDELASLVKTLRRALKARED